MPAEEIVNSETLRQAIFILVIADSSMSHYLLHISVFHRYINLGRYGEVNII